MPIESEQNLYSISDLDPKSPNGSEKISDGDDHIRNIKLALQRTFPAIDGEVTADHEELSNLSGLTENVQDALPEAPTSEGSVLHNNGTRWAETSVLEIKGDAAFIPAFSGMGNVVLYVDDGGQIMAADMANTPGIQHPLNAHTDVSYPTAPQEDDVLIFNGTEWVNTPNRTGNMFKPCDQNRSPGGGFVYDPSSGWRSSQDSSGTYLFTVPNGVRFALVSIRGEGDSGPNTSLKIDGIETSSLGRGMSRWPNYQERDSGPMIEVKDTIEVNWGSGSYVTINGYFFEV